MARLIAMLRNNDSRRSALLGGSSLTLCHFSLAFVITGKHLRTVPKRFRFDSIRFDLSADFSVEIFPIFRGRQPSAKFTFTQRWSLAWPFRKFLMATAISSELTFTRTRNPNERGRTREKFNQRCCEIFAVSALLTVLSAPVKRPIHLCSSPFFL